MYGINIEGNERETERERDEREQRWRNRE